MSERSTQEDQSTEVVPPNILDENERAHQSPEVSEEAREEFAYEVRQENRALRKQGFCIVDAPKEPYRAKILGSLDMEGGSCVFLELQNPGGKRRECVIVESPQLERWEVAGEEHVISALRVDEFVEWAKPESMVLVRGSQVVLNYDAWQAARNEDSAKKIRRLENRAKRKIRQVTFDLMLEGFEPACSPQSREARGQVQEREVPAREVGVDDEAEMKRELQLVRVGRQVRDLRLKLGRLEKREELTPPDGQPLEVVASIKGVDTQHVVVKWTQQEGTTETRHFAVLEPSHLIDVKVVEGSDGSLALKRESSDVGSIAPGDKLSMYQGQLERSCHQQRESLEKERLRRKLANIEFHLELLESSREKAIERALERSHALCEAMEQTGRKLDDKLEELVWVQRLGRQESDSWADVVVTLGFAGCVVFGVFCFVTGRLDLDAPMRSLRPESKQAKLERLNKEVAVLGAELDRERLEREYETRLEAAKRVAKLREAERREAQQKQKEQPDESAQEEVEEQDEPEESPKEQEPVEKPEDYKIERVLSHDGGVLIWRDDGSTFFHKGGVRYAAPSFEVVGWHWEDVPKQLPEYPTQSQEEGR